MYGLAAPHGARPNPIAPSMADTATSNSQGRSDLLERLLERIETGRLSLPLLPQSATQVLALCNDSECDMRELSSCIERDPALAGNVLRVANSATYAPAEPIVTVHQAASRLGFSVLCEIAVAVAVRGQVFKLPGREAQLARIWRHSALCAAWAKEIARRRRRNVEGAYLCGLLHDIGRPVLMQTVHELSGGSNAAVPEEEQLLDRFHAEVGARLLLEWKMPEWMIHAIDCHHQPERAEQYAEQAWITLLADDFARWSAAPDEALAEQLRAHPSLSTLSLYEEDIAALLQRAEHVQHHAEAIS